MKTITIPIIFSTFLFLFGCSSDKNRDARFLIRDHNKYGFMDMEGSIIVPAQYDSALTFSDERAGVLSNGLWGFINLNGQTVIKNKFARIERFSDGYALVSKTHGITTWNRRLCDFWFLIDKDGKYFRFDERFKDKAPLNPDSSNVSVSSLLSSGYLFFVKPFSYSEGFLPLPLGIINRFGNCVQIQNFTDESVQAHFPFSEGLSIGISIKDGNKVKYILVDTNGIITNNKWKDGYGEYLRGSVSDPLINKSFSEGLVDWEDVQYDSKVNISISIEGYLDKNGNWKIPSSIYEGSNKYYMLDGEPFSDSIGKVLVIDELKQFDRLSITQTMIDNYREKARIGYINHAGHFIIPPIYKAGKSFNEGLAAIQIADNNLYGFIDKTGKTIIQPVYDNAESFVNGLAKVEKDNKWTYIDKTGKIIWSEK